jgi:branched-chain amino acid transport system permease protein
VDVAQITVETISLASIYVLFALGLSLAWGVGKVLNLAHGAIFTISAYSIYVVTKHATPPLWLLVPIGALAGGAISLAMDVLFFRYIRTHRDTLERIELSQLIASLGAGIALVAVAAKYSKHSLQLLPSGIGSRRTFRFWGTHLTSTDITIIAAASALSALLIVVIQRTKVGRAVRAVAYSPSSSEILGINAQRVAAMTMFVSGALAGIAAALFSAQTLVFDPHQGDTYVLKGFAIVVLGGAGSVGGTVVGGVVLGLAETLTARYGDAHLVDSVAFVLIVVVLLIRPSGIFGRRSSVRA